jgi:hypothetical protein
MAPSDEGASLDAYYLSDEEKGIQRNASGRASKVPPHSAERRGISLSFWRQRERTYTEALIGETDPGRRTELEAAFFHARDNLRKAAQ